MTVAVNPNDTTPITDYCHRDETITEDGWCNRCDNYVALKTIGDDSPADPWRCECCGSLNVQQRAWVNVNTAEVESFIDGGRSDYYCEDCEEHNRIERESELLRRAVGWWGNADFRVMERITRYRQLDFDPDEGYQAFVDACNEWWNEKNTDEKIAIYINNQ